MHMTQYDDG